MGIPALSSHYSPHKVLSQMPPVFGRDAIYFLARRHWLISGMLSNLCSRAFLKDLWVLALVFPWVSLFYFFQTLERLSPKYATFNGRLCFSLIFLRLCSSTHKNSLTYFSFGILPLKCSEVSLFFPLLIFVSHIAFLQCSNCQWWLFLHGKLLHLKQVLHSFSLKFLSNSEINLF